jgi:hypothetical protein
MVGVWVDVDVVEVGPRGTCVSDIFVNENENENYCAFVHENENENFLKNENRIRTKINLSERIEINY